MSIRLRIIQRLYPIKTPETIQFKAIDTQDTLVDTIDFACINSPFPQLFPLIHQSLPTEFVVSFIPLGRTLPEPITLIHEHPSVEHFELLSATETPFELLPFPTVVGKEYKDREYSFGKGSNRGILTPQHSRRRARQKRRTTVDHDVFEQLRYILQPPIFKPDDQLTIFPNGLKPYPFQVTGVKWLIERKRALLADQMGLGKTIQSIIAMRVLFRNAELQTALVVCPASMRSVWEREIKSWAPELRPIRVQGNKRIRQDAWVAPVEIYIVSYESLARDAYDLASDRFDLCILDEAQKIKNPATLNHKAVLRLTPKYRWALTGTPIENSVEDVVSIFNFLRRSLFRNGIYTSATQARQKIAPYLLRRTIEDVQLDLPEVFHQNHWLELHPRQRSAYEQMELHGVDDIKRIGEEATRIHILALITRLKQICNYDDLSRQSCKLDFLADNLEDLVEDNDKALVFSQYVQTLRKIEPTLQRFKPLTYEGSLTSNKRDLVVSNFQEKDENMVLLMSVRAGGMGLTLTRANHVFHFDHWWNPAIVDQASARVRRIGQKKPVFVHSLYASNTIEERIFNLLEKKRALFQKVFGKEGAEIGDKELGRLSDEDLFGLFGLKPNMKDNATPYAASRIATQRRHNRTH